MVAIGKVTAMCLVGISITLLLFSIRNKQQFVFYEDADIV
jgi:hypothetical protein